MVTPRTGESAQRLSFKSSSKESEILSQVDEKLHQKEISHMEGLFWCLIFGLTRSGLTSGWKLARAMTQVQIHHVLLVRSICLVLGAYLYGKYDGCSFEVQ